MQGRAESGESVAGLSEGQRNCLRLVARGLSSKEIAIETGLTPHTVDTYIRQALPRLGASNRREAARMLVSLEGSQELRSQPAAVAPPSEAEQHVEAAGGHGWAAGLLPPPLGGRPNDLGPGERTLASIRIAALSAVMLIAIALVIAGAFEIFR